MHCFHLWISGRGKTTCTFITREFQAHKRRRDKWLSRPFYTHPQGYKFCLSVYANGYGDARGTHVSLYAHLMRGEYDSSLRWPFKGTITVQLLDQSGNERDYYPYTISFRSADQVTNGEVSAGKGKTDFVPHSGLSGSGFLWLFPWEYLKNDSLHFQVTAVTH